MPENQNYVFRLWLERISTDITRDAQLQLLAPTVTVIMSI